MKVLVVTQGKIASGAEKITSLLYSDFRKDTIIITGSKEQRDFFIQEKFQVNFVEGLTAFERGNFHINKIFYVFKSLPNIRKYIKKYKPKYIHVNNIASLLYTTIATLFMKTNIVLQVHDYYSEDKLVSIVARILKNKPAKVICVSSGVSEDLRNLNFSSEITTVIHNGVEFNHLPRGSDKPKIIIGFIGSIAEWKGLDVLLKSAANLNQYENLEYWIIGSFVDTKYEYKIKKMIEDYPNLNIIFFGKRLDIPELLCEIDILVHCSIKKDPFPTVVLEGMHAGCAVIASDTSGAKEIINHMKNGILHEAGSVESLTSNLKNLIASEKIRNRISIEARRFARTSLSTNSFKESFFEEIKDLMSK